MSAAAISTLHADPAPREAPPVPLYTRHMLGAIESARDHRIRAHEGAFVHRVLSHPPLRVLPGGGQTPTPAAAAGVRAL
jgi:hypothetical protein